MHQYKRIEPNANKDDYKVISKEDDLSLSRFEYVYAAAGHPNCVYKVNFENLLKMTNGKVEDFTE